MKEKKDMKKKRENHKELVDECQNGHRFLISPKKKKVKIEIC